MLTIKTYSKGATFYNAFLSRSGGDGAAIAYISSVGHTVQADGIHLLGVLAVVICHFQDREL
jgi:hypothetical protein